MNDLGSEKSCVIRALVKHIKESTENVLVGALAVALSVMSRGWPKDTDEDTILFVSCHQFFTWVLTLVSALYTKPSNKSHADEVLNKAHEISVALYGKERAAKAYVRAWGEYQSAMSQNKKDENTLCRLQ